MKKIILISLFLLIISLSNISAINELSIKDNNQYGAKLGYIDKATLVIEPFGSHVEQSLYLEYSDHHQFNSDLLEIVHRFELPKDAVVQDMWLWIGDSVVQAQMYDTWSARSVYDSIVAAKYDPAFLTKNGNQYELKVYPLAAGSFRKVKISFIVPTLWYGKQATAELPLEMLLSNNSTNKPLDILFKKKKNIWGTPSILENSSTAFVELTDTLDYNFQHVLLNDISEYSSLNLKFETQFIDGYFIDGYHDNSGSTYFQLGILPDQFFNVKADSSSQNILIALDFSGSFQKDFSNNLAQYQLLIENSLKPNDNFKLIVSGEGKILDFTDSFIQSSNNNINGAFEEFSNSDFAKSINETFISNILFCDNDASTNWNYENLTSVARVSNFQNIQSAMNGITQSNIVAAYQHGHDDPIDQNTADKIIERLDSLFLSGGRFLTYFDYNRDDSELIAKNYISGLRTKSKISTAVTLYRNPDGNIGMDFPESLTRNSAYFLEFDDPDVKIELMDENGNPTVISKKIGNGLIVVTGMWSLKDDNALKTMLGVPLLGVNSNKSPFLLDNLLNRIKEEYSKNIFNKVILLSDSDSLLSISDSKFLAQEYIQSFSDNIPTFKTINLLDNELFTPNYVTENQVEYFGSGYFLNELALISSGFHVEKHLFDWPYINSLFYPYSVPKLSNVNIDISVDDGVGHLNQIREVNVFPDPNKPRFFLGNSDANLKMNFSISGRFEGANIDSSNSFEFLIPHDTTSSNKVISSMLEYENIVDLFNDTPIDTVKIVKQSIMYNLLTDFTALLAIEPNETIHFMDNPFDESNLTDMDDINESDDSTFIFVYPNPFNGLATFKFYLKTPSIISASIYNSIGQKVLDIAIDENATGVHNYYWNAKNNYGSNVSSGFYIFRAIITDQMSKKQKVYTNKLMYLK